MYMYVMVHVCYGTCVLWYVCVIVCVCYMVRVCYYTCVLWYIYICYGYICSSDIDIPCTAVSLQTFSVYLETRNRNCSIPVTPATPTHSRAC